MALKSDIALTAVALAGILALGEASHRIELLAPPALAEPAPPDVCAEADLSYGFNRMLFFNGGFIGADRRRVVERFSSPPECRR